MPPPRVKPLVPRKLQPLPQVALPQVARPARPVVEPIAAEPIARKPPAGLDSKELAAWHVAQIQYPMHEDRPASAARA